MRKRTGHDFSSYKRATVMRRVLRRMQVCRVTSLAEYADLLRDTPGETVADAMSILEVESTIDGAVLDVSLGGEMVYPVADALADRDVPFVFLTGYDRASLPARYAERVSCEKPVEARLVVAAMGKAVQAISLNGSG